jgi:hypothetical protein
LHRALTDGRVDFIVAKQAVYVTSRGVQTMNIAARAENQSNPALTAAETVR